MQMQLPSAALAWFATIATSSGYTAHQPAHTSRQCGAVDSSFYLTGVPADGSATYPIYTAIVSRGVQTLSSATSYSDQWTYNTTDNRIYISNTTLGTAAQEEGDPVVFGSGLEDRPYGDNGLLSLVTEDNCTTYVVMTGAESVYGWWGEASDDGLPKVLAWYGDNENANAALRIGL